MIELIPAIDLIDGKCVRLSRGDFSTSKTYSSNPVDMAKMFEDGGFKRLHLVDLEGAGSGRLKHLKILEKIASGTGLVIDFGGGLKSLDDAKSIINSGAEMVCAGSIAIKNREEFLQILEYTGTSRLITAADTKNEMVVISGWKETTGTTIFDFLDEMVQIGVTSVLCTDVDYDGMLGGTSVELYKKIREQFPDLYIIASGGISSLNDFEILQNENIPAVVFGKAFYEGKISIEGMQRFIK